MLNDQLALFFTGTAKRKFISLLWLCVVVFATPSWSATWIGGDGYWNVNDPWYTNWDWWDYPDAGEDVYLVDTDSAKTIYYVNPSYDPVLNNLYIESGSGTATTLDQSQDALTTTNTYVGVWAGGKGSYRQSGGTHTVNESLVLGREAGSAGKYQLSGGSLIVDREEIGRHGSGTFIQEGGTHTVENNLFIDNGSDYSLEYHLKDGSLTSTSEDIGSSGTGTFTQDGGVHNVGDFTLGFNRGAQGTYNLNDGTLTAGSEYVGYWGRGSFNQSGGTHTVTQSLLLGMESGGVGEYQLSGGSLSVKREVIGSSGIGTFNQEGGTHLVSDNLHIGAYHDSSQGTYNLNNGQLTAKYEYIGSYGGGGSFTQESGTHKVSEKLYLGYNAGSFFSSSSKGTYTLNNGELTVKDEIIGCDGLGTFIQKNGTHIVDEDLSLGFHRYGKGSYTLNNGDLITKSETIGRDGTGTFVQEGGTHTVNEKLTLGSYRDSQGSYTLNNGTLTVKDETIGPNGTGTFTQKGGTHNVTGKLTIWTRGTYNQSGGELNVGQIDNRRHITQSSGHINVYGNVINYGTIETAENATFTQASGGTLTNLGTLKNSGLLTNNGNLVNRGSVVNTSTIRGNGDYTQTAGSTAITGSITQNTIDILGGSLSGSGKISGNTTIGNGATLMPGNSPGILTINGDLTLLTGSTTLIEIGGVLSGEYDMLNVSGTTALGGELQVSLWDWTDDGIDDPFAPRLGDSFDILTAENLLGDFDLVTLGVLGAGLDWQLDFLFNEFDTMDVLRLSVSAAPVPVPTTMLLFGTGLLGLAGVSRRKK